VAMGAKTSAEKKFDEILRRMLQAKPLSRSEISAKIQVRRKAIRGEK
jgi:predicted ArsR family transcriptional regulator